MGMSIFTGLSFFYYDIWRKHALNEVTYGNGSSTYYNNLYEQNDRMSLDLV